MPPVGPGLIRDMILALDAGAVFYSILYMGILFNRWFRDRVRKESDIRYIWSLFFFGLLGNISTFAITRLYPLELYMYDLLIRIGYISLIMAGTSIFVVLEKISNFKSKNIFSKSFTILSLVTIILPLELMGLLALFVSVLAISGLFYFINLSMKRISGNVRKNLDRIFLAIFLGFLGYVFRIEPFVELFGYEIYIIGGFLVLACLILLGEGILDSPALDELDWQKHLVELYVTHKSGSLVYHHSFIDSDVSRSALKAASISGAQSLFQEITSSDSKFDILSLGDRHILFAHESNFTVVLVSSQPYSILLSKVQEFAKNFQLVYGPAIDNFRSRITEFQSASDIIDIVFLS
ncbi:MAG: hypothetical protein GF411_06220 [Candidatus Lokiarchaeota archaeon]|nr:hypothetical protein [Candidatus Lokiarchaeota archaeon]